MSSESSSTAKFDLLFGQLDRLEGTLERVREKASEAASLTREVQRLEGEVKELRKKIEDAARDSTAQIDTVKKEFDTRITALKASVNATADAARIERNEMKTLVTGLQGGWRAIMTVGAAIGGLVGLIGGIAGLIKFFRDG